MLIPSSLSTSRKLNDTAKDRPKSSKESIIDVLGNQHSYSCVLRTNRFTVMPMLSDHQCPFTRGRIVKTTRYDIAAGKRINHFLLVDRINTKICLLRDLKMHEEQLYKMFMYLRNVCGATPK